MNKLWLMIIVGLILGYAFGSVLGPSNLMKGKEKVVEEEIPPVEEPDVQAADPVAVKAEMAVEEILDKSVEDGKWAEVNELTAALDSSRLEISQYVAKIDKLEEENEQLKKGGRGERESWADREARLKKEDPEAYAEREKQRKEYQQKMEGAIADKSAFLVNLDTSDMTEDEKKSHEELLGRIAEAWEVMTNMQEGKAPSREQMGSMRDNYRVIHDLYDQERDYVLRQVGKDLGYDKAKAAEFSTYIQDIYAKTSPSLPHGSFGGRGGGRSGGSGQPAEARPEAAK